jgi:hypothetical protein
MATARYVNTGLLMVAAAMLSAPVNSQTPTASATAPSAPTASPAFIPADFDPPVLAQAETFKLVPLGPDLVRVDYEAYMSSIEHLQQTFTRSTGWPNADLTMDDAMKDMESEQARFQQRKSFAYAVLTPDGTKELGSVYVRPSPVGAYDAAVSMWVTKAAYDAGFDAELYAWVGDWVQEEWPFANVVYPGRSVD